MAGYCHSDASPWRDTLEEFVFQILRGPPFEVFLRMTGYYRESSLEADFRVTTFCHSDASPRRDTLEESVLSFI
jgi:hypothetical protein